MSHRFVDDLGRGRVRLADRGAPSHADVARARGGRPGLARRSRRGGRPWTSVCARSASRPACLQLLDRHDRDGAALAERLGVPHHRRPRKALPGCSSRSSRSSAGRGWRENALWWPERRVLVDSGRGGHQTASTAPAAAPRRAHAAPRVARPPRALARFEPEHLLVGHGEGLHGPEASEELRAALRTARTAYPRWLVGLPVRRAAVAEAGGVRPRPRLPRRRPEAPRLTTHQKPRDAAPGTSHPSHPLHVRASSACSVPSHGPSLVRYPMLRRPGGDRRRRTPSLRSRPGRRRAAVSRRAQLPLRARTATMALRAGARRP